MNNELIEARLTEDQLTLIQEGLIALERHVVAEGVKKVQLIADLNGRLSCKRMDWFQGRK